MQAGKQLFVHWAQWRKIVHQGSRTGSKPWAIPIGIAAT